MLFQSRNMVGQLKKAYLHRPIRILHFLTPVRILLWFGLLYSNLAIQQWSTNIILIYVNKIHKFKIKLKNIKLNNEFSDRQAPDSWPPYNKTTGSMMINKFLDISSRNEGILLHSCKFYTGGTDNAKVSIIWRRFLFQFCRYAVPNF